MVKIMSINLSVVKVISTLSYTRNIKDRQIPYTLGSECIIVVLNPLLIDD